MKLHTVFITHNRLELTKQAIKSYLETVTLPYTFIIIDNASTDATKQWLWIDNKLPAIILNENEYPGAACNLGWSEAPDDATHLHRADNDFIFLPGWCDEVERKFRSRRLGQLGMRTDAEELHAEWNVGGNNIITRKIWDMGLRYDERPWPQIREEVGPGSSEDSLLSPMVRKMGFRWDRVDRPCIVNIDQKDRNDPYYVKSLTDRGIDIDAWM